MMDIREAERGVERRHPWELARLQVIFSLLRSFLSDMDRRNGTLLDVGCGDSFVARALARKYPNLSVIGVDNALTPEMICEIVPDRPPNMRLFSNSDDIETTAPVEGVLFLDVIEHLPQDHRFVRSMIDRRWIAEGALIMITVPAWPTLFSSHDRWLGHYRRYTLHGLIETARKAGIICMDSGFFFGSLLPIRAISVFKERWLESAESVTAGVGRWRGALWISECICNLLLFDFHISRILKRFNILVPGLSCYLIGRKSVS